MKFLSIKTVVGSLMGGIMMLLATSASAADLDALCDIKVFVSGASAQDESYVNQVRALMDTGLLTTIGPDTINNRDQFFGEQDDDFTLIIGTLDDAQISGYTGSDVACFYKRSAGGSAWGVQPVSQGTGLIGGAPSGYSLGTGIVMMIGTDCTTSTANPGEDQQGTCDMDVAGGAELIIPDIGLSDVEPAQFTSFNTPAPTFDSSTNNFNAGGLSDPTFVGMSTADVNALDINQQSMFVFGTIVNPEFYEALQVCQGLVADFTVDDFDNLDTMPSLTKGQIVGMFSGASIDLQSIPCTNSGTSKPAVMNLWEVANADGVAPNQTGAEVCTRVDGSGTQAQFRIKVLGTGCNANSFVDFAPPTATDIVPGVIDNTFALTENDSSSDMDACVGGIGNAQETLAERWKIGFNATGKVSSLDSTPGSADYYRFIKVDGQAPTLENTYDGGYFDAVQATLQTRSVNGGEYYDDIVDTTANGVSDIIDQLVTNFGSVSDVGSANSTAVGSAGTSGGVWYGGSMAISGVGASPCSLGASSAGFDGAAYPCAIVTHSPGTAVLDNCRVPVGVSEVLVVDGDGTTP